MKNLYYYAKSEKAAAALPAILADRKNMFTLWTRDTARTYDKRGNLVKEETRPLHFDAVEVWPDMDAENLAAAHKRAAARDTIRAKEEKAQAILAEGGKITIAQRYELLALVNVAYHEGGKIDGCFSIDSCAACEFCQKMIASAADNILVICGSCYAAADAWKENAWRQHKLNALILSSVLFTVKELKTLAIPGQRCRFNEDGDTVNETMARNYLRIAAGHYLVRFGYWYKNAVAVAAGLAAEGITNRSQLPQNVRFIHSSLLIGFPAAALWFDDAIFTVYPDAETTAAAIAAGAFACNGKRCKACDYNCYLMQRQESPLYIAEVLRASKENIKAKRAAFDARKAQIAALAG